MYSNKVYGDANYEIHHLPQTWNLYTPATPPPVSLGGRPIIHDYLISFLSSGNIHYSGLSRQIYGYQNTPITTYDDLLASGFYSSNLTTNNRYDTVHPNINMYIEWIDRKLVSSSGYYRNFNTTVGSYSVGDVPNSQVLKLNWPNSTLFTIDKIGLIITNFTLSGIPNVSGYPIQPSFENSGIKYDWYYWDGVSYNSIALSFRNGDTVLFSGLKYSNQYPHTYETGYYCLNNLGYDAFAGYAPSSGIYKSYLPNFKFQETVVSGSKYYYIYTHNNILLKPQEYYNPNISYSSGYYQEYESLKLAQDNVKMKMILKSDRLLKKECPYYRKYNSNTKKYMIGTNRFQYDSQFIEIDSFYKPSESGYADFFDLYGFPPSGEFNELWVTIVMSGAPYTLYYRGRDCDNIRINTIRSADRYTAPSTGNIYNYISITEDVIIPIYYLDNILYDDIKYDIDPSSYMRYRPKYIYNSNGNNNNAYYYRYLSYPNIDCFMPAKAWKGTIDNIIEEINELPNGLKLQDSRVRLTTNYPTSSFNINDTIRNGNIL